MHMYNNINHDFVIICSKLLPFFTIDYFRLHVFILHDTNLVVIEVIENLLPI